MPLLTLTFPPGTCAAISRSGGVWTVDSVNATDVVITVDDVDDDGTISNDEWDAAISGGGNDVGDGGFLFEGDGNSGFLYATSGTTTFTVGQDVTTIRTSLSNTFEADVSGVVCFARGTRIATPDGDVPIEALRAGDHVLTWKGQVFPIRWIGCRQVSEFEMRHAPKLRPVRVRAGALGPNLPTSDLLVSRQHRILLRSKIADRMFDSKEVLIPAIKLVGMPGIDIDDCVKSVDYYHILLDVHDVLIAEGAPAESLFTGPQALKSLPAEAVEEISTLFPEIVARISAEGTAKLVPPNSRAKQLLQRHKKHNRELICS